MASVSALCRHCWGSLTLEVGIKLRLFDTACSHLSGWALLLMVLDPTHTWPVVGIHVGSEKTVGYNGVDDEGGRVDVMAVSELEHNEEGHTLPCLMSWFCWFCVVSLQKKNGCNLCALLLIASILLLLVVEFLCSGHCEVR